MNTNRGIWRGKTKPKSNGKAFRNGWVEGNLIQSGDKYYIHPISNLVNVQGKLGRLVVMHEVDPETLGECTGLRDKNGKLIFEGDIVRLIYDGDEKIFVVIWDHDELDFKATNGKENYGAGGFQYLGCCEEIEVIGNVYDTPELLKGGENSA